MTAERGVKVQILHARVPCVNIGVSESERKTAMHAMMAQLWPGKTSSNPGNTIDFTVGMIASRLEGEGEADGVEAQQLHAPDDGGEVLRQAGAARPQAAHHGRARLKAEPVQTL